MTSVIYTLPRKVCLNGNIRLHTPLNSVYTPDRPPRAHTIDHRVKIGPTIALLVSRSPSSLSRLPRGIHSCSDNCGAKYFDARGSHVLTSVRSASPKMSTHAPACPTEHRVNAPMTFKCIFRRTWRSLFVVTHLLRREYHAVYLNAATIAAPNIKTRVEPTSARSTLPK